MVGVALVASGCPFAAPPTPVPVAPTPRVIIPEPRIQARAHPAFRLVIPPRPIGDPTRLVVVFVHIENIDDEPLVIRPDLIRLELPDGTTRFALDKPRAFEILKRSLLARFDAPNPRGDGEPSRIKSKPGISRSEQQRWEKRFRDELIANTRLSPGESIDGFVIVDTSRRFASLDDTVVEAVAVPADAPPGAVERYPVRVLLGAPIEIAP